MRRMLIALVVAAVALLGLAGPASAAGNGVDSTLNHVEYWEQGGLYTCTKMEYSDGMTSVFVPRGDGFLVVKAGRDVHQEWMGAYYYRWWTSPKDVSFIITCYHNS
ncbi:hypothetical protein Q6348_11105 [Isoptericola sp. b441]|uniref:Uncharacterized protein n=1 Tax=Actinotalea lenta TaxID=3064654 RepID=A0ABT9DA09_9CELL|nr:MULTISPECIES: hypothetical protein [unclassified Isoptericola]MDO8107744.1 hypothetical protein [Isoptericola sp. b441]MDO8120585.1 hypothetical protein [Isoptericola sp. b490]